MHFGRKVLFIGLAASSVTGATDAPIINNPLGAHYLAKAPGTGSGGNKAIIFQVSIETPTNSTKGAGALVTVNMNGPVMEGGPFLYHIHRNSVQANGSCDSTDGHLDPYNRGQSPPCDATKPQTCEVGDLSGKHGDIKSLPGFSTQYTDNYLSLVPGSPAFIGNRSLVLHYHNGTRIACANFISAANATANSTTHGFSAGNTLTSTPNAASTTTTTAAGIASTHTSTSTANDTTASSAAVRRTATPPVGAARVPLGPLLAAIALAVATLS